MTTNNSDVRTQNMKAGFELKCVIITVGVIGVCGNGFVLMVMLATKAIWKKTLNKFICNQAFIDLVASILLILHYAFDDINLVSPGVSSNIFCTIWISKYLMWASISASTYNLIGMTIQKYITIFYPAMHDKVFTSKGLVFFFTFPWIFGLVWKTFNAILTRMEGSVCIVSNYGSSKLAIGILSLCIDLVIPLATLIICYGRIVCFVHREYKVPRQEAQRLPHLITVNRVRMSALRTLVVVALCFFICFTPDIVYWAVHKFVGRQIADMPSEVYDFFVVLVYCNCLCNPVIYAALYRDFQNGVKLMLCKKSLDDDIDDDDNATVFNQHTIATSL